VNWISNVVRPKIRGLWTKRESRTIFGSKCPDSGEMVFHKDLEANQFVFPVPATTSGSTRAPACGSSSTARPGKRCPVRSGPVDPLAFATSGAIRSG
jgi:acetyl-CoA carboxylase carboxyl transferase subunit beta